jgi:hypothetical protein
MSVASNKKINNSIVGLPVTDNHYFSTASSPAMTEATAITVV